MDIQLENGEWTRLHNAILERLALARLSAAEFRCLMYLFRDTYGWQRKEHEISMAKWAEATGVDKAQRQNVWRTLQGMVAKRIIYAKSNGNNRPMTWGFNKRFAEWDPSLFAPTVITHDNSMEDETVIADDDSVESTVITHDNSMEDETVIAHDNSTVIAHDNSTVIAHDNSTVITGDNTYIGRKKEKEKVKKEGERSPHPRLRSIGHQTKRKSPYYDPRHFVGGYIPRGMGCNAVEVYYEFFCIRKQEEELNAINQDDLMLNCKDLSLLREVLQAYQRRNYKPRNIALILDWYREPHRFREKQNGTNHGNHRQPNEPPSGPAFTYAEFRDYRDPDGDDIPY